MPSKLENTTWYTIHEVATCLGKAYNTVAARVKEGCIKYSVIAGIRVVSHGDLVKALDDEKLPESIIEYRLGYRSPKTGEPIAQSKHVDTTIHS